jgi:acid phosphatase type 7
MAAVGILSSTTSVPAGTGPTETIIIAGDIAGSWGADAATAALVKGMPGIVMTAGDNVYDRGSATQFTTYYAPTWGQFLDRTYPVPGNHDWATADAAGYFGYFGTRAGPPGLGYYGFVAGTWHVYALSGDCSQVGGCARGSPQYEWLKAQLASESSRCVMAVWHEPRFSSGPHGDSLSVLPLLRVLYRAGAEIVVNGHDHLYERFGRSRPNGQRDRATGIRQFTVGTGGAPLYQIHHPLAPNSRVRASTHGVLKLTLWDGGYSWEFVPVAGGHFTDSGSSSCHGAPT